MKWALLVAVLLAGVSASAAFARVDNGKLNATMMDNGDVRMEIQLPSKEYYVIDRSMRDNHMNCRLEDFPGQSFTKILECGPNM